MTTHGAAFAGIGGAHAALDLLGRRDLEHSWSMEIEPYPRMVLEERYPAVPVLGDVQTEDPGHVELLTAGFPCQPFSVAGRREGEDDERNLWPATAGLIGRVRPRVVILENVPALRVPDGGRPAYFGTVLGDLAALGYDASWDCVPAAVVGAPHLRDRLWIVAWNATVEPFDPFAYYRGGAVANGPLWPGVTTRAANADAYTLDKGDPQARRPTLTGAAREAMWATPRAEDSEQTGAHRGVADTLTSQARSAMWPTPRATNSEIRTHKRTPSQEESGHGLYLQVEVKRAMWPTPASADHRDRGGDVPNTHRRQAIGKQINLGMAAGLALRARSGVLNPEWVETLMGYPAGWTDLEAEPGELHPSPWGVGPIVVGQLEGTNPEYADYWYGCEEYGPRAPLAARTAATTPRLKALGNAWVPQVAAPIAAACLEAMG